MDPWLFKEFSEKIACNGIYIKPANLEQLKERLSQTPMSTNEIESSLEEAKRAQRLCEEENLFPEQNVFVNDKLEEAYTRLKARLF